MATVGSPDHDDARTVGQESGGTHHLKDVLKEIEHDLIFNALRESRGNKAMAARALGITERLMGIRVKRLGIDWRGLRVRMKHRLDEAPQPNPAKIPTKRPNGQ